MVEEHGKKETDIRASGQEAMFSRVLAAHSRKQPVHHLTESKSEDNCHHGHLRFSIACSCDPENTGIQSQKKELMHSRPSSTEIAKTAIIDRRDRFVILVHETCFG